jgi:hypothetical protein
MPSNRLTQTLSALTRGLSNFCAVCCLAIAVCVVLANRGWISAWQAGVNAALFAVQGVREVYHTTRNPPSAAEYRRDPASWRELWRTQSWEGKITLVLIVADIVASIATQPQLALSTLLVSFGPATIFRPVLDYPRQHSRRRTLSSVPPSRPGCQRPSWSAGQQRGYQPRPALRNPGDRGESPPVTLSLGSITI